MCNKGVNPDQVKLMIGQSDDSLGMAQQWLEQIHHLADRGGFQEPSVEIAQASVLIGEARAKLQNAADLISGADASEASVELV
jgi:hypothetical protein